MKAKLGTLFMILGVGLLLSAGALFLRNQLEAHRAEQNCAIVMPQMAQAISESSREETESIVPGTPVELLRPKDVEMTEVEIDGHGYIGYLAIPALGLELPVMGSWSYDRLKIAPCRFFGTVMEENLVLIAHNYQRHFGNIGKLALGDEVTFVDMDGRITVYRVAVRDEVQPSAVEEVTAGDYPLTLCTCTYGGKTRLVVYCDYAPGFDGPLYPSFHLTESN